MTKEEYCKRMQEEEDWAPGWDAIDQEFERLYPGVEPAHYGTDFQERAMFGGDEFLDGYSIYPSGKGYQHIVTYGMSVLYADVEAFGESYNGWGYEMTMKLQEDRVEDCLWALDFLSILARYTYQSERYCKVGDCIPGNGTALRKGSAITAWVIVSDSSAQTQDTVHGKLEFLQLVGITAQEAAAIQADYHNLNVLLDRMRADNPELVTDMHRTHSYL